MSVHYQPHVAEPTATTSSASRSIGQSRPGGPSSDWVIRFVLLLIGFQVALVFLDQLTPVVGEARAVRVIFRVASFGASLLLLVLMPRRGWRHPATKSALWALAILIVSVLHPTTNTLLSGTAHAALYLAILAPLFWVPRLQIDVAAFRRIIFIFWGFHTLSAAAGVLQVYFPGQFQPSLSPIYAAKDPLYLEALKITTVSGQLVFRPMGFTDIPGGAAVSGFYAVLFAMGLLLTDRRTWPKVASVVSMILGMMVLYLSQVRSALAVTAICALVFAAILAWRRDLARLSVLATVLAIVTLGSFALAVSVGGESVTSRLSTLVAEDPGEVYHANRGVFLEETLEELLPLYPWGAGLGRHGMINTYFGDNSAPDRSAIWVEIQWTAWLLDGGVPLILVYVAMLLVTFWTAWGIARRRTSGSYEDLPFWGAMLLAYNIGALAWTFSYPIFMSQTGLEFWLLNAALFTAARSVRPAVTAPFR